MNRTVVGTAIGLDTLEEQKSVADAYLAAHGNGERFLTEAENQELAELVAKAAGDGTISHVHGFETINFDPHLSTGHNRPIPSFVHQVDGGGAFVALWMKVGTNNTDWINMSGGASIDAHTVLVAEGDTVPGKLAVKIIPGTNTTPVVVPDVGGNFKFKIDGAAFYEGPMMPNGGSGNSGAGLSGDSQVARGPHSHPESNPVVSGSTFYPVKISNPKVRTAARCILAHGETFGLDGSAWEQVAGQSIWQRTTAGQIYGRDAAGDSTIVLANLDRIVIWQLGGEGGDEAKYFGIYEVIDCGLNPNGLGGFTSTKATIRRASDTNTPSGLCNGMIVQITGTGVEYQGTYLTLTTADPIVVDTTDIAFSTSSSIADDTRHELLTAAQLTAEGATSENQYIAVTLTNTSVDLEPVFPTLDGTPGLGEIPAGLYNIAARLMVVADNPSANTVFKVKLAVKHANGTVDSPYATFTSPPIRSPLPWVYNFSGTTASPTSISPTDRIVLIPNVTTDSLTAMTVYFTYQNSDRHTRISLPFTVVAGVTTVPAGAITPGRLHTPFGTATIVDTRLTMPDRNDCLVTADASGNLTAIATAGWQAGDKIWLTVLDPINVIHNATSVPAGFAPLFLSSVAGVPGDIKTKPVSPTAGDLFNNRFQFQLRTDAGITPSPCWQLIAPHVAGKKA